MFTRDSSVVSITHLRGKALKMGRVVHNFRIPNTAAFDVTAMKTGVCVCQHNLNPKALV